MIALPDRLKALTLLHPWPYAITQLGKRIENRTWAPSILKKGDWFALHGAGPPAGRQAEAAEAIAKSLLFHQPRGTLDQMARGLSAGWFEYRVVGQHVGIFALAKYGGSVREHESPWFHGPVGWLLDEVVVLKEPIAVPGSQGLWDVPGWAAIAIRLEVEAMLHLSMLGTLSDEERKIPGVTGMVYLASFPDRESVLKKVAELGDGDYQATRDDRSVAHRFKVVAGVAHEWQGGELVRVEPA